MGCPPSSERRRSAWRAALDRSPADRRSPGHSSLGRSATCASRALSMHRSPATRHSAQSGTAARKLKRWPWVRWRRGEVHRQRDIAPASAPYRRRHAGSPVRLRVGVIGGEQPLRAGWPALRHVHVAAATIVAPPGTSRLVLSTEPWASSTALPFSEAMSSIIAWRAASSASARATSASRSARVGLTCIACRVILRLERVQGCDVRVRHDDLPGFRSSRDIKARIRRQPTRRRSANVADVSSTRRAGWTPIGLCSTMRKPW